MSILDAFKALLKTLFDWFTFGFKTSSNFNSFFGSNFNDTSFLVSCVGMWLVIFFLIWLFMYSVFKIVKVVF